MRPKINKKQVQELLDILAEKLQSPDNSEIRVSLRSMLDNADLRDLRDVMHLSGHKSVDYSFIKEDVLRTQLEVDNLRMEDAVCSTQIKDDAERFFIFCINAFYQIENITNYYFFKKYPNFADLLEYMEGHSNFKHKENKKTHEIIEKSVGDIDISCKLFALSNELFPSTEKQPDYTYKTINGLRLVRNEGFHRCQIEGNVANEKLSRFYKYNDFITVREILRKYVKAINAQLVKKQEENEMHNIIESKCCIIEGFMMQLSEDSMLSAKIHRNLSALGNPFYTLSLGENDGAKYYFSIPSKIVEKEKLDITADVDRASVRVFFVCLKDPTSYGMIAGISKQAQDFLQLYAIEKQKQIEKMAKTYYVATWATFNTK